MLRFHRYETISYIFWAYLDLFLLYLLIRFSKSESHTKDDPASIVHRDTESRSENINQQMLNDSEENKQKVV